MICVNIKALPLPCPQNTYCTGRRREKNTQLLQRPSTFGVPMILDVSSSVRCARPVSLRPEMAASLKLPLSVLCAVCGRIASVIIFAAVVRYSKVESSCVCDLSRCFVLKLAAHLRTDLYRESQTRHPAHKPRARPPNRLLRRPKLAPMRLGR